MPALTTLATEEREAVKTELKTRYDAFKARNLALDMTRGKPCSDQLDLANDMITCLGVDDFRAADGTDTRNYGGLDGIAEAKELFAAYMEVSPAELVIGGNSSLTLMHDTVARATLTGVPGGDGAWTDATFLCPCPGYDRHFSVCQHFGISMTVVDMDEHGPDMDQVEKLVANDATIKGMWCVPKYANPTGVTYSDEVVDRLAKMKTAAPDFRIFWDNAYSGHHLTDTPDPLKNILTACKEAGNPDRVFLFGSTSKITFAGAGLSLFAASEANIAWWKKHIAMQTIGPDKINQLRHVKFFGDLDGLKAHMQKHAKIIKPKFDAVLKILESELGGKEVASWSNPNGGYFISLDGPDGSAKKIIDMSAAAGVKLTPAGSTFPFKNDPRDRNIRISPTLPSQEEIEIAMEIVAICVQLVALETL